jgi:hypothetical protein
MLRPGDIIQVYTKQANRDANVLAVHNNLALIEFALPGGTSLLWEVYKANPQIKIKAVNYHRVPEYWKNELIAHQVAWIGKPKRNVATRDNSHIRARTVAVVLTPPY